MVNIVFLSSISQIFSYYFTTFHNISDLDPLFKTVFHTIFYNNFHNVSHLDPYQNSSWQLQQPT